ncbi:cytoskeleton-associated protein 2-like [Aulostomus maculatus]
MIQPRHTKTVLPRTSATIVASSTTSSVAKKVGSSISSSVPVSKGSWKAQKKTFTTPGLNQPVKEKTSLAWTQRAGITAQDPHKCNSKQPLGKPSHSACRVPRSNGLTSRFTTSMCASASVNSTHTSAGMPKGISRKQRSEIRGEKREPICKATSQTSSGSACDGSARVVSEVPRGVTDAKGEKNSIFKEKESKMGHRSIKACPRKMSEKRSSAPVMSQTVPRPARTISRARRTTDMKMPKLPVVVSQTVGNKLTAAQEERMRKLQEWRESKGISYKRPPMPVKPQVLPTMAMAQPFWAAMKVEDEAHTFICAVDKSLADCIKLLGESCPPDQVKKVLSRLPAVSQKFAKYWICKARLMEQEGNLDVLPLFEEAVRVVLEPVDELRSVVFEILKKKDELQASEEDKDSCPSNVESTPEGSNDPMTTPPKPVRALICGETGDSSVVKYKITATPRGPLSAHKQMAPARVNGQEVRFFTPVRRSVRIERASLQYPASLQEHDLCVTSYNDVMAAEDKNINEEIIGGESSPSADDTLMYVYRPNEALTDKVMVQFLCEEI